MSKKRSSLTVILALVSGLAGGMISSQLSVGKPVFAKTDRIITAEKFVLVDKGGVRGYWTTGKDGNVSLTMTSKVGLFLTDRNNRERAEISLEGLTVSARLMGNAGQVLWKKP